jgi:hypothetical protein
VAAAREHPALATLLGFVAVALVVDGLVALLVAPSNWDSMTYHLSRAAYWLQFHSADHYPGGTVRQLGSPPNAEMLQAWTMLLSGTDRFASLVQWIALLGLGTTVFSGARLLGFPAPASLFAAGLFVAMPQPILQASTTQNDLVVSFLVTASALFAVRGLRDRAHGDLAVAAAAGGLAVGAKGTALVAGAGLLILIAAAIRRYRPGRHTIVVGATLAVGSIAVFGSFNYVLNARAGHLFGGVNQQVKRTSAVPANAMRVGWGFLDTPGMSLPWLDLASRRPAQELFPDVEQVVAPAPEFHYQIDSSVQEDTSGFGLVGFVFLVPVILIAALGRRSAPRQRVLALASLAYFALFVATLEWNPWIGRVLIPMVALGAPLLACLYWRPWTRIAAVILALASLVPCVIINQQKTLLVEKGQKNILQLDRIAQESVIRPQMDSVIRYVLGHVRPGQSVGVAGNEDSWDYPFFGEHRDRRVYRLDPPKVTYETIRQKRLAGVVFEDVGPPPRPLRGVQIGSGFYFVRSTPPAPESR